MEKLITLNEFDIWFLEYAKGRESFLDKKILRDAFDVGDKTQKRKIDKFADLIFDAMNADSWKEMRDILNKAPGIYLKKESNNNT